MSVLLESRDICKYFGGVKAVDHVNMRISKGEIFGIIGPNGAGKYLFQRDHRPVQCNTRKCFV